MNGKKIFAMADILGIKAGKKTLAERKVMDGVEEVRLAGTVVTHEAVYFPRKIKFRTGVIFKTDKQ